MKKRILSVLLAMFMVVSMIPFTSSAAALVEFSVLSKCTSFEQPWGGGNGKDNYVVRGFNGFQTNVDAPEGYKATLITRNPEYADIDAFRSQDNAVLTADQFKPNLFSYNRLEVGGTPVKASDALYLVMDYYYDTTGRTGVDDEVYENFTGRKFAMTIDSYYNGETKVSKNASAVSTATIEADKWARIVLPLESFWTTQLGENYATGYVGQLKIYPFGAANGNMHLGDKFYIKGMRFMSYDPDNYVAQKRLISVYASQTDADEGNDPIDEQYVDDLAEYTLPAMPANLIPANHQFLYYALGGSTAHYQPGDKFVVRGSGVLFYAVYATPSTVNFTVPEGTNFTRQWMLNTTNKLPDAPEVPAAYEAGTMFAGWVDSKTSTKYAAGADYLFTDATVSFTASFALPGSYYVSSAGSIAGLEEETIYTTLNDAFAAVANDTGYGTIFVSGTQYISSINIAAANVTIVGYDETATLVSAQKADLTDLGNAFWNGTGALPSTVTIESILIKRGDTPNDENWWALSNIDLVIADTCTYQSGKQTGSQTTLNLYFANQQSSKGHSITSRAPLRISTVSPGGTWCGGGQTYTGNYSYDFANATIGTAWLGTRNGYPSQNIATVNGNVDITLTDTVITSAVGVSLYPVNINGNGTINITGTSNIKNVRYGTDNGSGKTTKITGDFIVNIDAKDLTGFPNFVKSASTLECGNSAIIVNNYEAVPIEKGVPSNIGAKRIVKVINGKAEFKGGNSFAFHADAANANIVLINEVPATPVSENIYTLPEGESVITFGVEGAAHYDLYYSYEGSNVLIGSYEESSIVALPASLSIPGKVLVGFTYGGNAYAAGGYFTMPAGNTVLTPVLADEGNLTVYVSSTGSDSNLGFAEEVPLATIARAMQVIGANDGTIILTDMVYNFPPSISLGANQTLKITGLGYEGAGFANGVTRVAVNSGHLILEHLIDYNEVSGATNTPFNIFGNATLTIGEGYQLATKGESGMAIMGGTQVDCYNANNPTININGPISQLALLDWGSSNITGDLTINIGATGRGGAVYIGGDHDSASTVNVAGKTFINITDNQSEFKIYKGGFKGVVTTKINGLQIVSKNSNPVIAEHSKKKEYINNGDEYIVNVSAAFDGADVVTTSFGKVNITIPAGCVCQIENADATQPSVTLETSGEYTLTPGTTNISFGSDATVTIKDHAGNVITTRTAGTNYVLPAYPTVTGSIVHAYSIGGTKYFAGDTITLPLVESDVVLGIWTAATDASIYLDATNGADTNAGIGADEAVKTLDEAYKHLAAFEKPKLVIVGSFEAASPNFKDLGNKTLTITGHDETSRLIGHNAIVFRTNVVLDNIGYGITALYKHFDLGGFNFKTTKTAYKVEGTHADFHTGNNNADFTHDQTIEIASQIGKLYLGGYYIPTGQTRTVSGNITVTIKDGGSANYIAYGDGYQGNMGKNIVTGNLDVKIEKGGKLNAVSLTSQTLESFTGVANVISAYAGTRLDRMDGANQNATLVYDAYNMITGREGEHTFITRDVASTTKGINTVGNSLTLGAGKHILVPGKTFESGLAVAGAQIRLATGTTPQALRFVGRYYDTLAAENEGHEFGFFVMPEKVLNGMPILSNLQITVDSTDYTPYKVAATRIFSKEEDHVVFTAAMTGLVPEQYNTKYTVVAYVMNDSGEYTYGERYTCSVADIANAIIADENATDELKAEMQALLNSIPAAE